MRTHACMHAHTHAHTRTHKHIRSLLTWTDIRFMGDGVACSAGVSVLVLWLLEVAEAG